MSNETKVRVLGRLLGQEISPKETEDVSGGWIPMSYFQTGYSTGETSTDVDESDSRG